MAGELGLECRSGHGGTIDDLRDLLAQEYVVIVEYALPEEDIGHFGILKDIVRKEAGGEEVVRLWQPTKEYDQNPEYPVPKFLKLWHEGHRFHGKHGGFVALKKKPPEAAENSA